MHQTKAIILAAISLFFSLDSITQTCCDLSATDKFAALSGDENFRSTHAEPMDFVLTNPMGENISYETPDGKTANAYLISAKEESDKYLFVLHEWWGLNDYVKKQAEKYYNDLENVNVICLDLFDGKSTTKREEASKLMEQAEEERILHIVHGAINYVGESAEVGTIGWCFGGGWSLQTAIELGDQAAGCVIYYGMPETDPERLEKLETDVLGIFANEDKWINPQVVEQFEENMKEVDQDLTVHAFDADHAFANPSNPVYDKQATARAYDISLAFLRGHLE